MLDVMDAAADQICERCRRDCIEGEVMYGNVDRVFGHDPYGLNSLSMGGTDSDYDLSSGRVSSGWICGGCFA